MLILKVNHKESIELKNKAPSPSNIQSYFLDDWGIFHKTSKTGIAIIKSVSPAGNTGNINKRCRVCQRGDINGKHPKNLCLNLHACKYVPAKQ